MSSSAYAYSVVLVLVLVLVLAQPPALINPGHKSVILIENGAG
jgi:hypothetical protein